MSEDTFGCHNQKVVATGMLWLEARDATGHLTCTGQSPTTKDYPAPNVTESKFTLLAARQANKSRDELWGKKQQLYLESQQTEKMVDQCPKEPSSPSQNSTFFYTKRGGGIVGCCKFLGARILCSSAVHIGLVTMFL